MNVLLISPKVMVPGWESLCGGYTIGGGILYIAATVRQAGYNVAVELGNEDNIISLIKKHSPEVVGVTCLTATYPTAKNVINLIKKYDPAILTVLGGHYATFMTREIFSECSVDYILRGEGEIAFPKLLKEIETGNTYSIIEGIAFRKMNQIFNEQSYTLLTDIDTLPYPAIDLIPKEIKYFIPIIHTSRGCPYRCSFCSISAFYDGKWRARKIENIIAEIEANASQGVKRFFFSDDNLTVDTKRVRTICKELKDKGLDDLQWRCLSRVDSIYKDPVMIDKMADSGCTSMSLGIESGVQEILNRYKKNISLTHVEEAVKIMNDSSIFHGWYMIIGSGDEFDTPKYIEKNIDFMKKVKFDVLQISILTPFPGTEFYAKMVAENRLLHKNWNKYDCTHCVYQPLHMTPEQIEQYHIKAYRTLYLDRGLDLFKMAYKGFNSGFLSPTMILASGKHSLDFIFNKKKLYELT
jgi:radical SAM superfamily enzyme YgiQ (UPF0313 family)